MQSGNTLSARLRRLDLDAVGAYARKNKPDDGTQLDKLSSWAPDVETRNRILAAIPAQLYGFCG